MKNILMKKRIQNIIYRSKNDLSFHTYDMKMGSFWSLPEVEVQVLKMSVNDDNSLTIHYNSNNEYGIYRGQIRYLDEHHGYFLTDDMKAKFKLQDLNTKTIGWLFARVKDTILTHYPIDCTICGCAKISKDHDHTITIDKDNINYYCLTLTSQGIGTVSLYKNGKYQTSDDTDYYNYSNIPDWPLGILDTPHTREQSTIESTLYIYSLETYRYKKIGSGKIDICDHCYRLALPNGEYYYAYRDQEKQLMFLKYVFKYKPVVYEKHFDEVFEQKEYVIPIEKMIESS